MKTTMIAILLMATLIHATRAQAEPARPCAPTAIQSAVPLVGPTCGTASPARVTAARVDVTCTSAGSRADGYLEIAIASGSGLVVGDDLIVTAASVATPTRCASGERPTVVVRTRDAADWSSPVVATVVEVTAGKSGLALLRAAGVRAPREVELGAAPRRGSRACAVVSAPVPAVLCDDVAGVARGQRPWLSTVAPLGSGGAPVVDSAGLVVGILTSTARCTSGTACGSVVEPIPAALIARATRSN
jgi:hypothetical protein